MEEQAMIVMPAFEFHVRGTSISGHVTAQTFEEAKDILSKISLGPKKIFKTEENITLIQATDFILCNESVKNTIFQISYVNGE